MTVIGARKVKSLSTSLSAGHDHTDRARGHVVDARTCEDNAWCEIQLANGAWAVRRWHSSHVEWAMAVCALLAWVRYGGES